LSAANRSGSIQIRMAMGRPPTTSTRCTPASVESWGCMLRVSQSVSAGISRAEDVKLR